MSPLRKPHHGRERQAVLGAIGAWAGGANIAQAIIRVTFRGVFAMAVTAGIGLALGRAV